MRENEPIKVGILGKSFVIILHEGKVNALEEKCTHEQGPLSEGYIDGNEIVCPWHSGAFDISTGKANENTTWVTDTKSYNVEENSSGELEITI
ncbi:MAG: Rieske (2Fe-2S) protein [Candidatus Micrarchaeia archaeon]